MNQPRSPGASTVILPFFATLSVSGRDSVGTLEAFISVRVLSFPLVYLSVSGIVLSLLSLQHEHGKCHFIEITGFEITPATPQSSNSSRIGEKQRPSKKAVTMATENIEK